jgi:hypothetical protein
MTRKHFIAMAAEIKEIADLTARKQAALAFCNVARAVNSRFNQQRFLTACEV